MNNAKLTKAANVEEGMTLKYNNGLYNNGFLETFEMQVQYTDQLRTGQIVLKGKVTKILTTGKREHWHSLYTLIVNPKKMFQVLN
jgi:hypothetical protein